MRRLLIVAALVVAGCGGGQAAVAPTVEIVVPDPTPEPVIGSGIVTFGTAYDPDTLLITKPLTTFKLKTKTIAWSASFSEPAGATSIEMILASVSKTGAETVLIQTPTSVSSPEFDLLANKADLVTLVGGKAGTYVLRYLRGSTILAEGTFTLTK